MCALLQGCALIVPQTMMMRDNWPADLPRRVEWKDVPFFPQDDFQCGPAALATALNHLNVPVTPDELVKEVYIPARKGSLQVEMLAAPRRHGLVSYALAPSYLDVLREIAAGNPVIVLQNYGFWPIEVWHYAVAIGYDGITGGIILRSGEKRRLWLPFPALEYTWKKSDYWAMVAVPPSRLPATADRERYLQAIVAVEKAGEPRTAAAAYAAYLKRWPDELAASIGLANAYYALHDLKQAESALRQALVREPESVIVLNNLAQTLSDSGRGDEALELIERAAAKGGPYANAVQETRSLILQRLQQQ